MKVTRTHGDVRNAIELHSASDYTVAPNYYIPEKYKKENIRHEKVLNLDLLKQELEGIIKRTPLIVLPFRWPNIENFHIQKAEVTQFAKIDEEDFIISATLYPSGSLEMIEPDLNHDGITYFRSLPNYVTMAFDELIVRIIRFV